MRRRTAVVRRHQVRHAIGGGPVSDVNLRAGVAREGPTRAAKSSIRHGASGFACSASYAAAIGGSLRARGQLEPGFSASHARIR